MGSDFVLVLLGRSFFVTFAVLELEFVKFNLLKDIIQCLGSEDDQKPVQSCYLFVRI